MTRGPSWPWTKDTHQAYLSQIEAYKELCRNETAISDVMLKRCAIDTKGSVATILSKAQRISHNEIPVKFKVSHDVICRIVDFGPQLSQVLIFKLLTQKKRHYYSGRFVVVVKLAANWWWWLWRKKKLLLKLISTPRLIENLTDKSESWPETLSRWQMKLEKWFFLIKLEEDQIKAHFVQHVQQEL